LQVRGFKFLILLLFFSPHFLFSFNFSSKIFSNLHNDRYWHTLLHFKNGESEIDDEKFFLSPNGKQDAKAELKETIKALLRDKNEIICRFPARINWIMKKLPELKSEVGEYSCKEIDKLIDDFDPKQISLIFPTAHINSPASMYGHTLLRIDADKDTPLLSQAINYAAKTEEDNGILFAFYGLSGGYEGRYTILPYYDKVKEYSDMEARDIWEYELNLNQDEIKLLLYHQFELKDIYADYLFMTENCSYNLLWLLESARANTYLVDEFRFKAVPIDTIRTLKSAGFIKNITYRASKSKKIKAITLKIEDKNRAKKFLQDGYNFNLLKDFNDTQKAHILDLSTHMLQYKRSKNKIDKKLYIKNLMMLLNTRSKLPSFDTDKIKEPINPLNGHKSNRVTLSIDEDKRVFLAYKPVFHDIYDVDSGFTEGAYINFFDLVLKKDKHSDIKLEKFDFVNIASYAKRDFLFKPLSWEVEAGWQRNHEDKLEFKLKGGVGYTYGKEGFLYYFFLNPAFYYASDAVFGIAPKVGFIKNFLNFKVGLNLKTEFLTTGDKITEFEAFTTYNLYKNLAINLKYDITKFKERDKKLGTISLFYYF